MEISKRLGLIALLLIVGTLKVGLAEEITNEALNLGYPTALLNQSPVNFPKQVQVTITAYSSRIEETDDTPFITASGGKVRSGVIAANWLPFGTKVKIPKIFGDRIFVVEDRMHEKNKNKLDIWFPTTSEAINFGVKTAIVEVL